MSSFNNDKKTPIKEDNQKDDYYCHGCESGVDCASSHTEKCQQMIKYSHLLHKKYLTQSVLVSDK